MILLAIGALAVLAAAYAGGWLILADRWRTGIAAWAASQTASGWTISTGTVAVSGFPGKIHLTVAEPRARDAAGDEWAGPPLAILVWPFHPLDPGIEAPGTHRVTLAGRSPVEISAAPLVGHLTVERGKPVALSLAAGSLAGLGMNLAGLTIELSRPNAQPDATEPPPLTAIVGIDRLTLPEELRQPLDRTIAAAHLAVRLKGALPKGPRIAALTAWRDGGGTLEIDSFDLSWPPLAAAGNATIALDRTLQPELAGTVALKGAIEAIDRAGASGMIDRDSATIAKLALRLATQRTEDGAKEARLAVTVQNRVLSVGPAPLLQMPEIEW
jgi:hypothetical protein